MIKQLIIREKDKIRMDKEVSNALVINVYLFFRLIQLGVNFFVSRFYLRKCNQLGRIVFTRGKPKITNQGTITIGNLVRIWSNINCVRFDVGKGGELIIGDNCRINGSSISATNSVQIGNNCRIAPYVIIMDDDFHDTGDRLSKGKTNPIIIKDDAWVATRAMILKGVTIGKGAVVASGAVVTKSVPDYCVAAGVPAKVVKQLKPANNDADDDSKIKPLYGSKTG